MTRINDTYTLIKELVEARYNGTLAKAEISDTIVYEEEGTHSAITANIVIACNGKNFNFSASAQSPGKLIDQLASTLP